jgi:uroporphyrinogen decarboxylase
MMFVSSIGRTSRGVEENRMNSRERVLLALNHKEPDRIPISFGEIHTSLHHKAHDALLKHLGLPLTEAKIMDRFQMIVDPAPALKEMFHSDVIGISANPGTGWKLEIDPKEDTWTDEWGVTYRRPPGGYWYDFKNHPLKKGTMEELNQYRWPDPRDPNRVRGLVERVKSLFEETDKALVMYKSIGGVYEHSYWLRGLENLYLDMATNLKYVEALAEEILGWKMEWWDQVLGAVGEYVQAVYMGDDLGSMEGPLFSPKIYRQVYKPRHKRLTEFLHKKAPRAKVYLHSCGSIYDFLPDIIECGIDIINPVQVSAKNMESDRLKREFGKDLVFWGGGADATKAMSFYRPADVKEEVKRRIHDFAPGGGFVFGSIHNIQADVPPENIVAFFEAAHEYGNYPIRR